jgi:hypothetical protein
MHPIDDGVNPVDVFPHGAANRSIPLESHRHKAGEHRVVDGSRQVHGPPARRGMRRAGVADQNRWSQWVARAPFVLQTASRREGRVGNQQIERLRSHFICGRADSRTPHRLEAVG